MGYVVALTGGIGSGKSTIANFFANFGIDIVDADLIARQLVAPGTPVLTTIKNHFGNSILLPCGDLNRAALRRHIFNHPEDKSWLNHLLHPLIQQETQHQLTKATSPYVLWVVPLLVENQLQNKVNRILVVDLDHETQLARTMARDNMTEREAQRIISAQATRQQRLAIADDVINNGDKIQQIELSVAALHKRYLKFAASTSNIG